MFNTILLKSCFLVNSPLVFEEINNKPYQKLSFFFLLDSETTMCDAIKMDTGHHAFVQTHRVPKPRVPLM